MPCGVALEGKIRGGGNDTTSGSVRGWVGDLDVARAVGVGGTCELRRRATCAKANASASCESGGGGDTVDEWIKRLPDKKEPLYSHNLPCIEAWLRGLRFFQIKEDRALWHIHKPDWRAQLSLDITDLYISLSFCGAVIGPNLQEKSAGTYVGAIVGSNLQVGKMCSVHSEPPPELLLKLGTYSICVECPEQDRDSFPRLMFLVEEAHWYYEDHTREKHPNFISLSLRDFTTLLFLSCDVLRPWVPEIHKILTEFRKFKTQNPVAGAIILNQHYDKCLLVKGWNRGASWGFPKGKKKMAESDSTCAIREVMEETGYDTSNQLNVHDCLQGYCGEKRLVLFIIGGVKEDTSFAPRTKKEISEIGWFNIMASCILFGGLSNRNLALHGGVQGLCVPGQLQMMFGQSKLQGKGVTEQNADE
ncbi:hypothetical protein KI387_014590, partial [Taxus chinensis]